jgi:hypothetical protein
VAKATAKLTDKPDRSDFQDELDDTTPLPLLPDGSVASTKAANDTAFALSNKAAIEGLERLTNLTKSIDKYLERVADALDTTQSLLSPAHKKKSRSDT